MTHLFINLSAVRVAFLYELVKSVIENKSEDSIFLKRQLRPSLVQMADETFSNSMHAIWSNNENKQQSAFYRKLLTNTNIHMCVIRATKSEQEQFKTELVRLYSMLSERDKEICLNYLTLLRTMKPIANNVAISFHVQRSENKLFRLATIFTFPRTMFFDRTLSRTIFRWIVGEEGIIGGVVTYISK